MAAYVRCGQCDGYSSCSRCPADLRLGSDAYRNAGCQECANRYERTLKDLMITKDLTHQLKMEIEQLQAQIKFLQSNNAYADRDPSSFFKGGGDLEIEIEDDVLQAHSLILADKSIVFRKMFGFQMVKKETRVVRIQGTTLPVMSAVIDFCYTAEISFTDEVTPEEVLKTAHKYVIDHLRDVCVKVLVTKINDENLAEMLRLSSVCEAKELREAALQYLKANFDRVTPSLNFEKCV